MIAFDAIYSSDLGVIKILIDSKINTTGAQKKINMISRYTSTFARKKRESIFSLS